MKEGGDYLIIVPKNKQNQATPKQVTQCVYIRHLIAKIKRNSSYCIFVITGINFELIKSTSLFYIRYRLEFKELVFISYLSDLNLKK